MFKNINDDRLLPCPFCGEDAVIGWVQEEGKRDRYYVGCSNDKCGCELMDVEPFHDLDKLVKVWNTRKLVKEDGKWVIT